MGGDDGVFERGVGVGGERRKLDEEIYISHPESVSKTDFIAALLICVIVEHLGGTAHRRQSNRFRMLRAHSLKIAT